MERGFSFTKLVVRGHNFYLFSISGAKIRVSKLVVREPNFYLFNVSGAKILV